MLRLLVTLPFLLSGPVWSDTIRLTPQTDETAPEFNSSELAVMRLMVPLAYTLGSWTRISPRLVTLYQSADPAGDGFTLEDSDAQSLVGAAARRALEIQKYLELDVNGDQQITDADLRVLARAPLKARVGRQSFSITPSDDQQELIMRLIKETSRLPDANRDGVVTLEEMIAAAAAERAYVQEPSFREAEITLELDEDGDGIVLFEEFMELANRMFGRFDATTDGFLDRDEVSEIRKALNQSKDLDTD